MKYYSYFVLYVSASKHENGNGSGLTQETGETPHPHELFVPLLTFIPTKSPVLTRPWVLITSAFVEENLVGLVVSVVLIFYLGNYMELIWGARELVRFVTLIITITNLSVYIWYTIKSLLVTMDSVPPVIASALAINMGLLVAMKQRLSNHYFIFIKGNVRIKVTHIPLIYLIFSFILECLSEEYEASFMLAFVGFFVSWTYLRFFKSGTNDRQSYLLPLTAKKNNTTMINNNHNNTDSIVGESAIVDSSSSTQSLTRESSSRFKLPINSTKGDRTDQFALYTFFPYPISILIKIISNLVFNLLIKFKVLNPQDYPESEQDDVDQDKIFFEELNTLRSNLFSLSSLKGAKHVTTLPDATSKFKVFLNWIIGKSSRSGIKSTMDKRRKLALKELE